MKVLDNDQLWTKWYYVTTDRLTVPWCKQHTFVKLEQFKSQYYEWLDITRQKKLNRILND